MTRTRRLAPAVALCCAVGLAAALVLASRGRVELAEAREAWRVGDARSAISAARASASDCVPWAEHVALAHAELREIANAMEQRGDPVTAIFAWRASRAASHACRWWMLGTSPEEEQTGAAIERLAKVQRAQPRDLSRDRTAVGRSRPTYVAAHAGGAPRRGWTFVLMCGAAAWLIGTYRLTALWNESSSWRSTRVRTACALAVAGAGGWVVALVMS